MAEPKRKQRAQFQNFFPEDIMVEILKRLPLKPLFRSIIVSKQFKSIVSDPNFGRSYRSQYGGLLYPYEIYISPKSGYNKRFQWVMFPIPISFGCKELAVQSPQASNQLHPPFLFYFSHSYSECARILASSNGLVLSQTDPYLLYTSTAFNYNVKIYLRVSNPLTRQSVNLPWISNHSGMTCGLSTRRSEAVNAPYSIAFKVVSIRRDFRVYSFQRNDPERRNTVDISIFSSDVGRWEPVPNVKTCPYELLEDYTRENDFCHKGILHWLHKATRTMFTYDPFDSPDRFGRVRFPPVDGATGKIVASMNVAHVGHEDDSINWCEIERCAGGISLSLNLWRLVDYGKEEWRLEKRCEISPLCGSDNILWLLTDCRQVIAMDPWNHHTYCYIFGRDKRITSINLASGNEEDVDVLNDSKGMHIAFDKLPLIPFAFCPWSSLDSQILKVTDYVEGRRAGEKAG